MLWEFIRKNLTGKASPNAVIVTVFFYDNTLDILPQGSLLSLKVRNISSTLQQELGNSYQQGRVKRMYK